MNSRSLYKWAQLMRDAEVLGGKHGIERYTKRRLRRVVRRKGLGTWYRRTGL